MIESLLIWGWRKGKGKKKERCDSILAGPKAPFKASTFTHDTQSQFLKETLWLSERSEREGEGEETFFLSSALVWSHSLKRDPVH